VGVQMRLAGSSAVHLCLCGLDCMWAGELAGHCGTKETSGWKVYKHERP
jgi:hypothetical protein